MAKHLYLHVPFCKTICSYCDFCHVTYQSKRVRKWIEALTYEMKDKEIDTELETIYIGGGTPTSLSVGELTEVLELLKPYSSKVKEYTIEANPETVTEEMVMVLKQFGVNRVSMGVQSTQDSLLKLMNRHHSKEDVTSAVLAFQKEGITNISLDAMYSLPGQTIQDFKETLEYFVSLNIPHISLYSLTIEPNTVFGRKNYDHLEDDIEADMYDMAIEFLENHGFTQYEISNFCKKGYESLHNTAYWEYKDFYGISLGASGKENSIRYDNTKNMEKYYNHVYVDTFTPLTKEDQMFETLMMGLRMKRGFSLSSFKDTYGVDFDSIYGPQKETCIKKGYLMQKEDYIFCTEYGFHICNTVIEEFMQ